MLVSVGNVGNEDDLIIGNIPPVIAVAENITRDLVFREYTFTEQRFVLAFFFFQTVRHASDDFPLFTT